MTEKIKLEIAKLERRLKEIEKQKIQKMEEILKLEKELTKFIK